MRVSQVCELDIIFNFEKAYFMLDELVVGGEVCETSKKNVLKAIAAQDLLQEVSYFTQYLRLLLSLVHNFTVTQGCQIGLVF